METTKRRQNQAQRRTGAMYSSIVLFFATFALAVTSVFFYFRAYESDVGRFTEDLNHAKAEMSESQKAMEAATTANVDMAKLLQDVVKRVEHLEGRTIDVNVKAPERFKVEIVDAPLRSGVPLIEKVRKQRQPSRTQ